MRPFSRQLKHWDVLRLAATVVAVAWIAIVAGYVFGAAESNFALNPGLSAAAALAIAAAGILYAWREPAPLDR